MLADPAFTLHLRETATADLPATARDVDDPEERRAVFAAILGNLGRAGEMEAWMTSSPLVEAVLAPG